MVSTGLPQPLAVSEKKNKKKKRKNSSKSKEHSSLRELKTLGHQLLSSRAYINNLPILLTYVSPSSPPTHTLEALLSLQSFFTPLLPHLPSSSSKPSSEDDDPDFIYRTWLGSKFDALLHSILVITLSSQSDQALREVVLDTIMEFVKVGNAGSFHSAIYHKFLHGLVHSLLLVGDILLDLLVSKYFKYIDVCYFTYISLEKLASTLDAKDLSESRSMGLDADAGSHSRASLELSVQKIHHILSHIPPQDRLGKGSAYEMWNGSGIFIRELNDKEHSVLSNANEKKTESLTENVKAAVNISKKMKLKFSKAWLSFLRLQLPLDVYKEVLVNLHRLVIPHMTNPRMLCDFLTRSYDIGGVISVMALSSLYILMTQHGLEYPKFYEKLYALLEPSIFMAKHRAKFFELLDSCLKSPLLPAYLAAAFAKKLSRLALSVPPSGALVIIALVHNLLRRHPSINCLVHREDSDAANKDPLRSENNSSDSVGDSCASMDLSNDKPGIDHFKIEESDPVNSHAMRSSLWEIDTLHHHYCPPVSRFVLSLENDLTLRAKTTEMEIKDFSSGSYTTIFREEMRRRVKQVPLAFYKSTPVSLFSESDFPGWAFNFRSDEEPISSVDKLDKTRDVFGEHHNNSAKRQRIEGL